MTSTDYRTMFIADRDAARQTVRNWRNAVELLDSITADDVFNNETPDHTINVFVHEVGEDLARFVVASLVNRSAWDGRIYPNVAAWAQTVENSLDDDACRDAMIYTKMHMAHLNQAAQAMMNYKPETEEDTETKEEGDETMNTKNIIDQIKAEIEKRTERSAWSHGVTNYALELLAELSEAIEDGYFDLSDLAAPKLLDRQLLNGADDWSQYSWGGCSLIYDYDIAKRLCNPSELKKTRNGERRPNSREEWLDVQARALYQASNRVKRSIYAVISKSANA